ncbi:MAG: sigma-70 family RNA polymerase sigma factor [Synergistaceae bacterium]|jgi:RNA polymerase sporulation-specific sigma factor|nr:sigma-70 family RNA polymerase sigma factor [Synergistaceae bacterium]
MKDGSGNSSLDRREERELWDLIELGDDDAREKIIMSYRPMVFWMAKKFRVPYNSYPDLIQEGMIGLIAAVDNFDVGRNIRFITYAYYKVRGRMVNFLQRSEAKAPLPVEEEYLERGDSFEAELDKIEWQLAIREGFEHLSSREREIISSLLIEGRRASDVATEHGVGISHIYRLQRGAIARLKGWFSKGDATSGA